MVTVAQLRSGLTSNLYKLWSNFIFWSYIVTLANSWSPWRYISWYSTRTLQGARTSASRRVPLQDTQRHSWRHKTWSTAQHTAIRKYQFLSISCGYCPFTLHQTITKLQPGVATTDIDVYFSGGKAAELQNWILRRTITLKKGFIVTRVLTRSSVLD